MKPGTFEELRAWKMVEGEKKYGKFDPWWDWHHRKRVFGDEGISEVLDASNYVRMGAIRLPCLRLQSYPIQVVLRIAFWLLRRFGAREREILNSNY